MKFVIYAPSFTQKSGGVIVLHLLCDLLNRQKHQAFIAKSMFVPKNKNNCFKYSWFKFKRFIRNLFFYKLNPNFITPIISKRNITERDIVIYPAIISGNPLNAECVVRWFLHKPGFFTGEVNYGERELYFYYAKHFNCYKLNPNDKNKLTLVWLNDHVFKKTNFGKRSGTCYMLRKGKVDRLFMI